jgi:arginase
MFDEKKPNARLVLLGIPSDLGANERGSDKGPQAIRRYLLPLLKDAGYAYDDLGDVPVPRRPEKTDPHKQNFKELRELSEEIAKTSLKENDFPIFFGGDHSVEDGVMQLLTKKRELGLVWIDAHADFNNIRTSQESPWGGGHIHGMVLAEIVGHALIRYGHKHAKVKEQNVLLMGLRDVDRTENKNLRKSGIHHYSISKVKRFGMKKIVGKHLSDLENGTTGFHVTIDVDGLDPSIAPGVSTPVRNGITKTQIKEAISTLAKGKMLSLDFMELNPLNDKGGKSAKLVAELILHALSCLEKNGRLFSRVQKRR